MDFTANREAYGAAEAALDSYAGSTDAAAIATTGDEILSVARLLAREPRLRRALADPARVGPQRAALLGDVLGGKIGADAERLVGEVVAQRWSSAVELLGAVERLGVDTLLAGSERAGELADVEDELFRFGQVVSGDDRLAATVGDSSMSADRRADLVTGLLEGKAKPATVRLAQLAVHGFGGRAFANGLTRLVELAAARRHAQLAFVTVAEPLSDAEEGRLAAVLTSTYGRRVGLKVTVDPSVLGGMSVLIGDDLYDGTVARRLAQARQGLTA